MDFEKRFRKEVEEYQTKRRCELEEQQRREYEKLRQAADERQRYNVKVERAHALLMPILKDFIKTTGFKLIRVLPAFPKTLYEYKVTRKKEGWLIWAVTLDVTQIEFGCDRGIVRLDHSEIQKYKEEDLLDEERLKERFTEFLIDKGKWHLSS
jgi:hypothetical protein